MGNKLLIVEGNRIGDLEKAIGRLGESDLAVAHGRFGLDFDPLPFRPARKRAFDEIRRAMKEFGVNLAVIHGYGKSSSPDGTLSHVVGLCAAMVGLPFDPSTYSTHHGKFYLLDPEHIEEFSYLQASSDRQFIAEVIEGYY